MGDPFLNDDVHRDQKVPTGNVRASRGGGLQFEPETHNFSHVV